MFYTKPKMAAEQQQHYKYSPSATRAQTPSYDATPNPFSLQDQSAPTVRLPSAVIQQAVSRLSRAHTPATDWSPVCKKVALPAVQVRSSVERLYSGSLQHRASEKEALERKILVDKRKHTKMSSDDLHESVARLYTSSVKLKFENHQRLARKFLQNYETTKDERAAEKAAHSVEHLYTEELTRQKERRKQLVDKYINATEPKVKKVAPHEIGGVVARVSRPKSERGVSR